MDGPQVLRVKIREQSSHVSGREQEGKVMLLTHIQKVLFSLTKVFPQEKLFYQSLTKLGLSPNQQGGYTRGMYKHQPPPALLCYLREMQAEKHV